LRELQLTAETEISGINFSTLRFTAFRGNSTCIFSIIHRDLGTSTGSKDTKNTKREKIKMVYIFRPAERIIFSLYAPYQVKQRWAQGTSPCHLEVLQAGRTFVDHSVPFWQRRQGPGPVGVGGQGTQPMDNPYLEVFWKL
jgi:hypothetical protein